MTPREIAILGRADGAQDFLQADSIDEARRRRALHRRRCAIGAERNLFDFAFRLGFSDAADRESQP